MTIRNAESQCVTARAQQLRYPARERRRDVQQIMERLAEAGGRRTASRQAIIEVIVEAGSHLTADEIAAESLAQRVHVTPDVCGD